MCRKVRMFLAGTLTIWVFGSGPLVSVASAQVVANEASGELDEIIVTARRRSESLQDTPISVAAFSAEQIEQQGITNLIDLDSAVPNLSLGGGDNTSGSNSVGVTIRGVGDGSRINVDGAVGFYIDDVFVPRLTGTLVDLLDVESIQVLRGPQGTLFGRNTTGGAVLYNSKKPVAGEFESYLRATVGSFSRQEIAGMVNVPVSDRSALRLSAYFRDREGYIDNHLGEVDMANLAIIDTGVQDLGNNENSGVRLGFSFQPTDSITVDLTGTYIEDKGNGPAIRVTNWNVDARRGEGDPCRILARAVVGAREVRRPPGGTCTLERAPDPSLDGPALTNPLLSDVIADTFNVMSGDNTQGGLANLEDFTTELWSAVVSWDISENVNLISRTSNLIVESRILNDNDYTPVVWRERDRRGRSDSFSQELLLNGGSDSVDWTAGVYYFSEGPEELTFGSDNGTPNVFIRNEALDAESLALFGEATFQVSDPFSVTLGYRWTEDEKTLTAVADGPISSRDRDFVPDPSDPPAPSQASASDDWTSNTWRVSLQYDWSDNVMTYFTASTGFRSGGFNNELDLKFGPEDNFGILPFDPEEVDAYEVGLRSDLADGRFRLNATVYWQDWTNRQLRTVREDGTRLVANAGDAESQGIEVDAIWQATDSLVLSASVGTIDGNWTAIDPLVADNILIDSEPQRMPDLSYSLGLLHEHTTANGANVVTSLNYGWRDDQQSSSLETRTIPIEAYGLLQARVKWTSTEDKWSVALFCTNCLDEDYILTGGDFTGLTPNHARVGDRGREGYRWEEIGRPQEWGVEFGINFN